MVGLGKPMMAAFACPAILLYSVMVSRDERFSANSEISAPEMNALPPAPLRTTTRISLSRSNSAMISGTAFHMSRETALCRAGLLNCIQPIGPSLRAIIRSVLVFIGSSHMLRRPLSWSICPLNDLPRAKPGDRLVVIAVFPEHFLGMLAFFRRRMGDPA